MKTIDALKITMEGTVTSFRYPHFTQGFQPTYEMPPPSTIYGHICSVLGRFLSEEERKQIRFGYCFRHSGRFIDYKEHLHFDDPIQPFPFDRELLFEPRLTLYLTGLDLEAAFRNPYYVAVLGRSQDLMTYTQIERVSLQQADIGYFEHTLLPAWMAPRLSKTLSVATMSRYIDARRRPSWSAYALLSDVAIWPPQPAYFDDEEEEEFDFTVAGDESRIELWIDAETPAHRQYPDARRAVYLHSFGE